MQSTSPGAVVLAVGLTLHSLSDHEASIVCRSWESYIRGSSDYQYSHPDMFAGEPPHQVHRKKM